MGPSNTMAEMHEKIALYLAGMSFREYRSFQGVAEIEAITV